MSDDVQGGRPDFTWMPADTQAPTLASQAAPATATTIRRRPRTILLIGIIVIALVAAGLISWFTFRGKPIGRWSAACPATATDGSGFATANGSSDGPLTLSFNPVDNLPLPDMTQVVGMWCGAAVFDFTYLNSPEKTINHDVLRGVDFATGQILWTLATLPNGSNFVISGGWDGLFEDAGKLAITLLEVDENTRPSEQYCIVGTHELIMSVRTGVVLASSFYPAACSTATQTVQTESIIAYQEGVVVIQRGVGTSFPEVVTATAAYGETDLSTPLWYMTGQVDTADGWFGSTNVLPGGWVKAVPNGYVSVTDGHPAGFSLVNPPAGVAQFFAAGPMAVSTIATPVSGFPISDSYDSLSGWPDMKAAQPAWRYESPTGWNIGEIEAASLQSSPVLVVTKNLIVIVEYQWDDTRALLAARATAIGMADGKPRWSVPLSFDALSVHESCGTTITGDADTSATFEFPAGHAPGCVQILSVSALVTDVAGQSTVVVQDGRKLQLIDAASGRVTASRDIQALGTASLQPCGRDVVCLLDKYIDTNVTSIDLSSSTLQTRHGFPKLPFVTALSGGVAAASTPSGDLIGVLLGFGFQFVILRG